MRFIEFITPLPKNQWQLLMSNSDKHEWADNLIKIVDNAYSKTNLGSFIKNVNDVSNSDWNVLDWDPDDEIDVAIFYRKPRANETWAGYKIQGLGHDGQAMSKSKSIEKLVSLLNQSGWWIEASDALEKVLHSRGVQPILDHELIEKIFPESSVTFLNKTGRYSRRIPGGYIYETMFGKPTLK